MNPETKIPQPTAGPRYADNWPRHRSKARTRRRGLHVPYELRRARA